MVGGDCIYVGVGRRVVRPICVRTWLWTAGYGQVRLSVVLSKRQWRVRESWVNAWAESSVRTHTPGPTSGLAITKDRGPMAEGSLP